MNHPEENGRTESFASGYEPLELRFNPLEDSFPTKDRKYDHFDYKLTEDARTNLNLRDTNLKEHNFWPLLGFNIPRRKRLHDSNGKFIGYENKPRPIKFGSHYDAALLELYSRDLNPKYEKLLESEDFGKSVLAYRRNVGDNIIQAKYLFDEIIHYEKCTAIALDISGFFNNIRHDVLKEGLVQVLGDAHLPKEDYYILRNACKFSWVDSEALKQRLGKKYNVKGRICFPREFRNLVRGKEPNLVQTNPFPFGIPQGLPISGLYANISLIDFDRTIFSYIHKLGGSYRRYSDDIALIIPKHVSISNVITEIELELSKVGLVINPDKTDISSFQITKDNLIISDKPFQYLGFKFDGQKVLIRESSIHNYYRKMRSGIRTKVRAAHQKGIPANEIYVRQLFKRYTHFGKKRNFPRYAYRAAEHFKSEDIRKQLSAHMKRFKKFYKIAIHEIYK